MEETKKLFKMKRWKLEIDVQTICGLLMQSTVHVRQICKYLHSERLSHL